MSVNCSRVRAQVSLRLDDELSQLERRMLSAHIERCDPCRFYAEEVEEFTLALRAAPPMSLDRPIAVPSPRRVSIPRMQAGVAAVIAVAALGLASQMSPSSAGEASLSKLSVTVTRFPRRAETERELALLQRLPGRGPQSVAGSTLL